MASIIIELQKVAMAGRAPISALLRKALVRISEPPLKARFMIATPLRDIIMPHSDGEDMTPAKPDLMACDE